MRGAGGTSRGPGLLGLGGGLLLVALYLGLAAVLPSHGVYERLEPTLGQGFLLAAARFVGVLDPLGSPLFALLLAGLSVGLILSAVAGLFGRGRGRDAIISADASGAVPARAGVVGDARERLRQAGYDVRSRSSEDETSGLASLGAPVEGFAVIGRIGLAAILLAVLINGVIGFSGTETVPLDRPASIPRTSFESVLGRRWGPGAELREEVRRDGRRVRLALGELEERTTYEAVHRLSSRILDLARRVVVRYAPAIARGRFDLPGAADRGRALREHLLAIARDPTGVESPGSGSPVLEEARDLGLSPRAVADLAGEVRTIVGGGRASRRTGLSLAAGEDRVTLAGWRGLLRELGRSLLRVTALLDRIRDAVAIPARDRLAIEPTALEATYVWERPRVPLWPEGGEEVRAPRAFADRFARTWGLEATAWATARRGGIVDFATALPGLVAAGVARRHVRVAGPPDGWSDVGPRLARSARARLRLHPVLRVGEREARPVRLRRVRLAGPTLDLAWSVSGPAHRVRLAIGSEGREVAGVEGEVMELPGEEGPLRVRPLVLPPGEAADGGPAVPGGVLVQVASGEEAGTWDTLEEGEVEVVAGRTVRLVAVEPGLAVAWDVRPARLLLWFGIILATIGGLGVLLLRRVRVTFAIADGALSYRIRVEGVRGDPAEAEASIRGILGDLTRIDETVSKLDREEDEAEAEAGHPVDIPETRKVEPVEEPEPPEEEPADPDRDEAPPILPEDIDLGDEEPGEPRDG